MAWVAVNKNGDETISPEKPLRYRGCWEFDKDIYIEEGYGYVTITITLPKGSIYKLIGRELTWKDEPVELD